MPYTPRALVVVPEIDVKSLLGDIDLVIDNISKAIVDANIRNTAITVREGKRWLLFPFLDKGTKPHWIDTKEDDVAELLGSVEHDFGPVHGPIHHPGTRPYDISARVATYLEQTMEGLFNNIDSTDTNVVTSNKFNEIIRLAMSQALDFAVRITPDNWVSVKNSYQVYIKGRRYL
jgi:hypothetical protein